MVGNRGGEVVDRGGVEPEVVEVAFDEATADRLGHDVTGREVGQRVLVGHERHAAFVAQDRALAPQRLGEERARHRRVVQRGGVELHELEVGDRGAGAHGHGDAVAGGEGGVGGDGEALTGAARRDEHVASPHRRRTLGRDPVDPHDAAVLEQELGSQPAFADVGARTLHRGDQRPLDFGAGGVTPRVHDPGDGVPALARAGEVVAAIGLVEVRAQGDELADPGRTLAGQHPHRVDVAETRTRDQRVRPVQLG